MIVSLIDYFDKAMDTERLRNDVKFIDIGYQRGVPAGIEDNDPNATKMIHEMLNETIATINREYLPMNTTPRAAEKMAYQKATVYRALGRALSADYKAKELFKKISGEYNSVKGIQIINEIGMLVKDCYKSTLALKIQIAEYETNLKNDIKEVFAKFFQLLKEGTSDAVRKNQSNISINTFTQSPPNVDLAAQASTGIEEIPSDETVIAVDEQPDAMSSKLPTVTNSNGDQNTHVITFKPKRLYQGDHNQPTKKTRWNWWSNAVPFNFSLSLIPFEIFFIFFILSFCF